MSTPHTHTPDPGGPVLVVPPWQVPHAAADAAALDPEVTAGQARAELAGVPFQLQQPDGTLATVTLVGQAASAGITVDELLDRYTASADAGTVRWRHDTCTVVPGHPGR